MSLAAITAKARGVVLHLGRADTGSYYCGGRRTKRTLHTWKPEEVTCKKCLERYREAKANEH
jgi:hypothetical protein